MEGYIYVLMRCWVRVDDVVFRVHDTRLYHVFGQDYMLREYQTREASFADIQHVTCWCLLSQIVLVGI